MVKVLSVAKVAQEEYRCDDHVQHIQAKANVHEEHKMCIRDRYGAGAGCGRISAFLS